MRVDSELKTGEYSFEYAVGINQWSMKLLGLWPLDRRLSSLKWSIAFTVTLAFLIPSLARMVTINGVKLIIEQAILTVPLFLLMIKLSYIRIRTRKFQVILDTMVRDWSKFYCLPDWGREIMIEYAKTGRRANIICISCMLISIAGYMTLPSGTGSNDIADNVTARKLPTEGVYPFDEKRSPIYEMIYLSQAIVSCLYTITTFSIDCFISVIIFHACGQLSALARVLEKYDKYTAHLQLKETNICTCSCLKCIVRQHVLIIRFMDLVEDSFSEFVLLQVIGNCFTLAAEGYQLVTYAEDSDALGFLTFASYTTTVTYNIFVYCYIGECIIEKSEEIGSTAYNLEWNNLPRRLAEPLILIQIRSRKPCKITAGGFAVVSLSYYKTILTTAISYISVLRALK